MRESSRWCRLMGMATEMNGSYCIDYPCCGHTYDDPCDAPAYDPYSDPHLCCEHEVGICQVRDLIDEMLDEYL